MFQSVRSPLDVAVSSLLHTDSFRRLRVKFLSTDMVIFRGNDIQCGNSVAAAYSTFGLFGFKQAAKCSQNKNFFPQGFFIPCISTYIVYKVKANKRNMNRTSKKLCSVLWPEIGNKGKWGKER